jgi:hypothetical protein
LKILQRSGASKPTFVLQLLRSRKEARDTVDLRQVPIPEADRSVLASDVVARVPSTRWLKKEEVKMKSCSRVTPLLMLQPMLQQTQRLMLQQTPRLMSLAMQPMLLTSRETLPQIQDAMQELSLLRSRPIVQKEVGVTA